MDARALAGSLSLAQREIVEVTSAFMREPRILFLDEPTSALAENDVAWLFGLVRELRDAGAAILFTSHRWNEVASLADRITILRNGEHVATRERFDENEAVTLMTGRTIDRMYPDKPAPARDADIVLEAQELRDDVLDGVSFQLRRGEILGVGGLAGHTPPAPVGSRSGESRPLRTPSRARLPRQAGCSSRRRRPQETRAPETSTSSRRSRRSSSEGSASSAGAAARSAPSRGRFPPPSLSTSSFFPGVTPSSTR